MEYTIYTPEGHWLGAVDCTNEMDIPIIKSGQQVILGNHQANTMLVANVVTPVNGDALNLYNERLLTDIRFQRNKLLSKCDWTDLPSTPLSIEKKAEWQNYRNALRDLPANTTDPENPEWPLPPQ